MSTKAGQAQIDVVGCRALISEGWACAARDDTDIAIVSGRALEDVRSLVKQPALVYAGNHGLEIAGPGIPSFVHEHLVHYHERAKGLADDLTQCASDGASLSQST